jgi:hypothetical protein
LKNAPTFYRLMRQAQQIKKPAKSALSFSSSALKTFPNPKKVTCGLKTTF